MDAASAPRIDFSNMVGPKRRRMRSGGNVSTITNNTPKDIQSSSLPTSIDDEKTVQTSKCKGSTTIPIFLKSEWAIRSEENWKPLNNCNEKTTILLLKIPLTTLCYCVRFNFLILQRRTRWSSQVLQKLQHGTYLFQILVDRVERAEGSWTWSRKYDAEWCCEQGLSMRTLWMHGRPLFQNDLFLRLFLEVPGTLWCSPSAIPLFMGLVSMRDSKI